MPEDLANMPDLPKAAEYIWYWFLELSSARGSNGFGANPITYPDIKAWAELTLSQPRPWEIELIKRLDNAYLASMVEEKKNVKK